MELAHGCAQLYLLVPLEVGDNNTGIERQLEILLMVPDACQISRLQVTPLSYSFRTTLNAQGWRRHGTDEASLIIRMLGLLECFYIKSEIAAW